MTDVSPDPLQQGAGEQAIVGISNLLFASTQYYGFATPQNGDWHSDAVGITQILAQGQPKVSPTLSIRSDSAVDMLQMTLTPQGGPALALNTFGGGGGVPFTLDANHLSNVLQVSLWGTSFSRYDTQRLGQLTIMFTADSGFPTQTFGSFDDVLLGTVDVEGWTLIGFTGNSGTMVDGLSLIFIQTR